MCGPLKFARYHKRDRAVISPRIMVMALKLRNCNADELAAEKKLSEVCYTEFGCADAALCDALVSIVIPNHCDDYSTITVTYSPCGRYFMATRSTSAFDTLRHSTSERS